MAGLLKECAAYGQTGILAHGRSLEKNGSLARIMGGCPKGVAVHTWRYAGEFEPALDDVEALRKVVREKNAAWVAGIGGGSVMDIAKAAAGLKDAPLAVEKYHDGAQIPESRVPFVAVPTTAGTGSEATAVCVVTNSKTGEKKSFRHPSMMARLVFLDSELMRGCLPGVIAASGLDALTQAIESYVSRGATWFSDELALRAVHMISANLRDVWQASAHWSQSLNTPRSSDATERVPPGRDLSNARQSEHAGEEWRAMLRQGRTEDGSTDVTVESVGRQAQELLEGSFLAGVALANARLGLVHGLAHPLGARFKVAHGAVCAVCLLPVLEFNMPVIAEKYGRMKEVFGEEPATAIAKLVRDLGVTSPFRGKTLADRDAVIREVLASGSTKANPRDVTAADVDRILDVLFRS